MSQKELSAANAVENNEPSVLRNKLAKTEKSLREYRASSDRMRIFLNLVANITSESNIDELRFKARSLIHETPRESLEKLLEEDLLQGNTKFVFTEFDSDSSCAPDLKRKAGTDLFKLMFS